MKAISVLGSTGSIGTQTLEIVEDFPDHFRVVALSAGRNLSLLVSQIQRHRPDVVVRNYDGRGNSFGMRGESELGGLFV